jgi:hypothetical protein
MSPQITRRGLAASKMERQLKCSDKERSRGGAVARRKEKMGQIAPFQFSAPPRLRANCFWETRLWAKPTSGPRRAPAKRAANNPGRKFARRAKILMDCGSDEFISYPRPSAKSAVLLMRIPTSADLAVIQGRSVTWLDEIRWRFTAVRSLVAFTYARS